MSGPIFVNNQASSNSNPNQGAGSYANTGAGPGSNCSFSVSRNSIIAQMNNASGKTKSQQVIVLDNIVNRVTTVLKSFRSREKIMIKMVDIIEAIINETGYSHPFFLDGAPIF